MTQTNSRLRPPAPTAPDGGHRAGWHARRSRAALSGLSARRHRSRGGRQRTVAAANGSRRDVSIALRSKFENERPGCREWLRQADCLARFFVHQRGPAAGDRAGFLPPAVDRALRREPGNRPIS